jgi:nicotinamidase-related amidase
MAQGTAALLAMDVQFAVCGPDGRIGTGSGLSRQTAERGVLPRLAHTLQVARAAGVPVLHARVAFDEAYTRRTNRSARFAGMEKNRLLLEGSDDAAFVPEAEPAPGEVVVTKGCVNPFIGTGLAERLVVAGVTRLYLAGVATNFVVESAARHAGDSGFQVSVLEDVCASYDQEMHDFAVRRTLPTFAEIIGAADFERRVNDEDGDLGPTTGGP